MVPELLNEWLEHAVPECPIPAVRAVLRIQRGRDSATEKHQPASSVGNSLISHIARLDESGKDKRLGWRRRAAKSDLLDQPVRFLTVRDLTQHLRPVSHLAHLRIGDGWVGRCARSDDRIDIE